MKKLFDFLCVNGHITEAYRDDSERTITCPECGKDAIRLVSAPQVKLEGFSGAFPGAYDKWNRLRTEHLAQERKRNS